MLLNLLEKMNCYVQKKFNLNDTVAAIPKSIFSTHGKIVKINWIGKENWNQNDKRILGGKYKIK